MKRQFSTPKYVFEPTKAQPERLKGIMRINQQNAATNGEKTNCLTPRKRGSRLTRPNDALERRVRGKNAPWGKKNARRAVNSL
jgi:hypothetical protein